MLGILDTIPYASIRKNVLTVFEVRFTDKDESCPGVESYEFSMTHQKDPPYTSHRITHMLLKVFQ